jgi:hypothetical protein
LWLAIGVFAIGVGIGSGNEARDVIRDARWWFMYGFAVVAIWTATRRPAVLRAVLVGSIAYSAILIAITLLPAFEGGLKERAATYDRGLLRLQFSNGVFVVFAAVWVINRWLRAPSRQGALWIPVLAAGVLLSLTRMSIFVLAALVAVSLILAIRRPAAVRSSLRPGRRALVVAALSVLPIAVAVSVMAGGAGGSDPTGPYRNLLQRFLFQDPASDVGAITEGRVETYRSALKLIGEHPIVGNGLGKLVDFGYVPGGARPATPGKQPSVDNAYLTVAMKAGFLGVCVFTVLAVWPLEELRRRPRDRWARPFLLSWLAILILTMTQSFATGGYSPFGLALLIAATAARPAALTLPGGVPPDRIQPTASAR